MNNLSKNLTEQDYRARMERRHISGTIVSVDKTTQTAIVDVGATDANGTPILLHDVPYQPHNPPQVQDTVTILYPNISTHAPVLGGSQVGSANAGQVVEVNGAITRLTALAPLVTTPDPITSVGVLSHSNSGVTPGVYANARVTVDAKGHVLAIAAGAVNSGGGLTLIPVSNGDADNPGLLFEDGALLFLEANS